MSTLTKVSIIVPVYNTEKYLRKCLDFPEFKVWKKLKFW